MCIRDRCELLQKEQLQVPLLVGGATTSTVHTAVKLAPKYDYCVVSGGDASRTVGIIKRLLNDRENYIREIKAEQENIRTLYNQHQQKQISLKEARRRAPLYDCCLLYTSFFKRCLKWQENPESAR